MSDIYATEEELLAFELKDWPTAPKTIESFRAIVKDKAARMIDGVFVDMMTAQAVVLVYDAISEDNKIKYMNLSVSRIGSIAWKAVK
jgi:hypothetical protein